MKRPRAWVRRLGGLLPNARRERERAEELDAHLEMQIDGNLRAGMNPAQARREALLKLDASPGREAYRDRGTVPLLENAAKDARFALRQLRKHPVFTLTAVLMLALGLGASVAIFAFTDAALLKPLPYKDAQRLVAVYETVPLFEHSNLSYPDFLDWKRMNQVFSHFDAYTATGMTLTTASGAAPSRGVRVTDGFFKTLGVTPVLGRDFYSGEDLLSAPRTVLLTYATWQQRYGGRRDVLGETVTLNGFAHVIIGVLPKDFHFAPAEPAQYWVPMHASSECDLRRSCHGMYGVARLKDGVAIEAALADVTRIAKQLEKVYPGDNRDQGASLLPLAKAIHGNVRTILLVLLGAAVLLLVIAGVNVAGLLLLRAEGRRREISVRTALGASRGRLFTQFAAESFVLAAAGSAAGIALAYWMIQVLLKLIPASMLAGMPFLLGLGMSPRVLAFAGGIALLAMLLFTFTPAAHLLSSQLRTGLAKGSRGSAGNAWRRLGSKLVVVELATAIVLLAGAGLLGKSLYRLLRADVGLRPDHLATLSVAVPAQGYPKNAQVQALVKQIVAQTLALPGVESVGISSDLPIHGWGDTTWVRILGRPWHGEHDEMPERDVSANYFTTLGAKLIRGRYFREDEDTSKPRVAIINQTYVKRYFPSEDPIGKQLSFLSTPPKPIEIVGVVADIKEGQIGSANQPALYLPFLQTENSFFNLAIRTRQAPELVFPEVHAAIRRIDPGIVTVGDATMDGLIQGSAYLPRSSAWLVGGFAALALLLSIFGLYGVVAYSVSQRTREIGVRMALGANAGAVCRLILREAGWLTAAGVLIGLALAAAAARLMQGMLYEGVRSWDAPTLAGVALLLGGCAVIASLLPARRAASVNPVEALRAE